MHAVWSAGPDGITVAAIWQQIAGEPAHAGELGHDSNAASKVRILFSGIVTGAVWGRPTHFIRRSALDDLDLKAATH